MCGIMGITGARDAASVLLEGLKRLEYRGYDSAGIVVANGHGLKWAKRPGKIATLSDHLKESPLHGTIGLGHTRWATHGPPTELNAHPHFSCDRRITLVHNGIIENYVELRRECQKRGHRIRTQTDTEILAHLIEDAYKGDPLAAVAKILKKLRGTYALAVLFADHPDTLIGARLNSPLLLGLGEGTQILASDFSAIVPHTRRVVVVEDHELIRLRPGTVEVFGPDLSARPVRVMTVDWSPEAAEKGGYAHYMLKEIYEQPRVVEAELVGRLQGDTAFFEGVPKSLLSRPKRITIAACGTAWHSGLIAKTALEELAGVPVEVGIASELRYGDPPYDRSSLLIAISQSGETQDTLAAARQAREAGATVLAITNIRGSTLSREADFVIPMRAGLEVGVAATKTYVSQVMNALLLAIACGRARGTLPVARARRLLKGARALAPQMETVLRQAAEIKKLGEKFSSGYDFMYIGRRYNLATAYEGALKMKEISYLHAEGYGAGEMKHGPLALVDAHLTTVAIAPQGRTFEKILSNIEEIRARGGGMISIATQGERRVESVSDHILRIPKCEEMFSPVLSVVPLQLLAYSTAVATNKDVDRPRNLAKSVTVE